MAKKLLQVQKSLRKRLKKFLLTFFVMFLLITYLFVFGPFAQKTEAAWFNDNWAYRKAITLTNNTTSEINKYGTLSAYDASDTTKYQADCGDARFTDQSGKVLRYTVASCGASTTFHVNVDSLPAGAQTIYLYYGNPSAANGFVPADPYGACTNCTFGSPASEEKGTAPIAYWRFDDAQGQNTQDATVNNLDGTLGSTGSSDTNDPTWQSSDQCVAAGCLSFDGTNDYTVVSDTSKLDITGNFTLSAWIRPTSVSATVAIITKESGGQSGYFLYLNGANVYTGFGSGAWLAQTTTSSPIVANQWSYVTVTWDGTNLITYVNGKQVQSSTHSGNPGANADNLYIGATGSSEYFPGFIDEPKVYDYALSAAQVTSNYSSRGSVKGTSITTANIQNMPAVLANGLVGYWKMDEASWTNDCSTASVLDASGNGNNGIACPNSTGPTGGAAGKFGNAGGFDGSDDKVTVPDSDSLDLVTGTMAVWIKQNATGSWQGLISKGDCNCAAGSNYQMEITDTNHLLIGVGNGTDSFGYDMTNVVLNDTSNWHHIVATWDGTTVSVYLDGQLKQSMAQVYTAAGTADTLHIGNYSGDVDYFSGEIDEARVYNRALSGNDISQLYNWAPGPIGYWKMDEGSWTNDCTTDTVLDSSGNGFNGDACPSSTGPLGGAVGKYGKAGSFDGSDDRIDIADNSGLHIPAGVGVTIMAWIKTTDTSGDILGKNAGGAGNKYLMSLSFGNITFYVQDTGANGVDNVGSVSGTNDGLWHHVAIAFDGATGKYIAYKDGAVAQTGTGTATTSTIANTGALVIGSSAYLGSIDEPKVYKYTRTQAQIIEDMNAGHPAPGSPVGSAVGYWKFDEGYGTTVNDSNGKTGGAENLTLSTATATWTLNGKFGKAFDGGDNKRASITTNANLEFSDTDDFAVSLWYKSDSASSPGARQYLLSNGPGSAAGYAVWANTDDTVCFGIDDDSTSDPPEVASCTTTDVYDGVWHHLVGVRDHTADTTYLYIDGKLKDSDTDSTTATLDSNSTLYLGDQNGTNGTDEFLGDLDEVKIFRSTLSASQVLIDMNRGASQVLGTLSTSSTAGNDNASTRTAQSSASEYCIPGDSATCTAPVGRWDLNEGSWTNDCSTDSVFDTSGGGTNGDACPNSTGPRGGAIGKISKGGNFDGSNDYVNLGTGLNLTGAMTISAWVKIETLNSSFRDFFTKMDSSGCNSPYEFGIGNDNLIYLGWTNDVCSYETYQATGFTPVVNRWYHITATRNAALDTVYIYVNGTRYSTSLAPGTGNVSIHTAGASPISIGRAGEFNDQYYDGTIDQIRLYNYERTPAQVAWDYNTGGPVAYWKMDECQGTVIHNSMGNTLVGTLSVGTPGTCGTSGSWFAGASGKRNASMDFNGSSDVIGVSDNDALDLITGTTTAWVKRDSVGSWHSILAKSNGAPAAARNYSLEFDPSSHIECGVGNGTTGQQALSTATFTDTTNWHMVSCTWDGTTVKIYYDGKQIYSTAQTAAGLGSAAGLLIGAYNSSSPTDFMDGKIDEARVYNYPLTAAQIKSLLNEGAVRFGPAAGTP